MDDRKSVSTSTQTTGIGFVEQLELSASPEAELRLQRALQPDDKGAEGCI